MEVAFFLFILKHFLCDFLLQRPYHYKNKGIYGHPGGLSHAAIHGAGTAAICIFLGFPLFFAVIDAVVHYHIDYAKTRLNQHFQLTPEKEAFWWLLGVDQTLHYLTYAAILALAFA